MSRLNGVADREKFTVRVELHDHTIMWSYLRDGIMDLSRMKMNTFNNVSSFKWNLNN